MVPEVATIHQATPGVPGAPWWVVGPSGAHLAIYYFPNFQNIPKLAEGKFVNFLESVYLSYHVPPLFQLFWSVLEGLPYVFFRCHGLNNIAFNINWRT
jgi:hypothetical protein